MNSRNFNSNAGIIVSAKTALKRLLGTFCFRHAKVSRTQQKPAEAERRIDPVVIAPIICPIIVLYSRPTRPTWREPSGRICQEIADLLNHAREILYPPKS